MKAILKKILNLKNYIYNFLKIRINNVSIGKNTKINGAIFLRNKGQINIGEDVIINSAYKFNPIGGQCMTSLVTESQGKIVISKGAGISNTSIYASKYVYIGEKAYIGGDCRIYDTDFHSLNYEKRVSDVDDDIRKKEVIIEEGCFIGASSIILKGVRIGKYSVVGAGSVVTKDIPSGEVWAGNPAKFIKKVS